mgnify:CR=1 FL=1
MKEIMDDPYFSESSSKCAFNRTYRSFLQNPNASIYGKMGSTIKKRAKALFSVICFEEDNDFIEINLLSSSSLVARGGYARQLLNESIQHSVKKNKPILAICSNWLDLPQLGFYLINGFKFLSYNDNEH